MAPLVRVEPSGISPNMFVSGFFFGGRLFEGVQQWQASMKASLREGSGGTQPASFDNHNFSLSAWSRP